MVPLWFTSEFPFRYTVKMFDVGNDCPALAYEYIFTGKRFISFTYLISIISVLHKVLTRCYSLRHWTWAGYGDVMFASDSFRSMLYIHHTQSQHWLTWQFSVSPFFWDLSRHFNEPLELLFYHSLNQTLCRKGCEWVQCSRRVIVDGKVADRQARAESCFTFPSLQCEWQSWSVAGW